MSKIAILFIISSIGFFISSILLLGGVLAINEIIVYIGLGLMLCAVILFIYSAYMLYKERKNNA